MYIPAEVVVQALQSFTGAELHCSRKEPLIGVRLAGSPVQQGYAYLLHGKDATRADEARFLICIGAPAVPPAHYIQVDADADLLTVFADLQDLFIEYPTLEAELARAAAEEGYEPLLNLAAKVLNNTVMLMNTRDRVRAAARLDQTRPEENSMRQLRALRRKGELEFVRSLNEPTECKFDDFNAPCIITNLFVEERLAGRLLLICHITPPSARMRFICSILAGYFERKVAHDEAFGDIRADDPLYSLFYDLASGYRLPEQVIEERLTLPGWRQGAYQVLVIPLEDEVGSFDYYAGELSKHFDAYSVLMGNQLVCTLHEADLHDAWGLWRKIDPFLTYADLRGGMSNVFIHLSQLREHLQQAMVTLQLAGDRHFSIYCDWAVDHLLTFFPPEQRSMLIHPALYRLQEVDRQHGTSYYETLRIYLECERSLSETSKRLFIHRNTLLYRLDKLCEQTGLRLDDADQRLHLRISFRLMRKREEEEQYAAN